MAGHILTPEVLILPAQEASINPLEKQNGFSKIDSSHFNVSYTQKTTWFKIPKELLALDPESDHLVFTSTIAGHVDMYVATEGHQLKKLAQSGSGYLAKDKQIRSFNRAV